MSLKKQYLKSKPVCKVTFTLDGELISHANSVCLAGDFNNWSPSKTPMKKLKDGSFKIVLDLTTGQQYQFRYLVDNKIWQNDSAADQYIPNPYGDADNCIVVV